LKPIDLETAQSLTLYGADGMVNTQEIVADKAASPEVGRRAYKSAAMIGLAISVGASGVFLPKPGEEVMAAEPIFANPVTSSAPVEAGNVQSLDAQGTNATQPAELAAPVAEYESFFYHQIQPGDTLWFLAQKYQVSQQAIATINEISIKTTLIVGQTIKIPGVQPAKPIEQEVLATAPQTDTPGNWQIRRAEATENMRAQVQNLREALGGWRSEATNSSSLGGWQSQTPPTIVASVPENPSPATSEARPQPSPVIVSNTESRPIAAATPTNQPQPSVQPVQPSPAAQSSPVIVAEARPTAQSSPVVLSTSEPRPINAAGVSGDNPVVAALPRPANLPVVEVVPEPETYLVQPGDTLDAIARRHGVSRRDLMAANRITNPNLIFVDQKLSIPSRPAPEATRVPVEPTNVATAPQQITIAPVVSQELSQANQDELVIERLRADIRRMRQDYQQNAQTAQPTPSLFSVTASPVVAPDRLPETDNTRVGRINPQFRAEPTNREPQLLAAAPVPPQNYNPMLQLPVGQVVSPQLPPLAPADRYLPDSPARFNGYIWPAEGVLTSGYGMRWGRLHAGIDIAAPIGTPIVAAAPGVVVTAGWNSGGYGYLVEIQHPDGSLTLYAHNNRILVREGQQVAQGEQIAEMGSTGFSTGPHLHFEIHPSGNGAANPMAFLPRE